MVDHGSHSLYIWWWIMVNTSYQWLMLVADVGLLCWLMLECVLFLSLLLLLVVDGLWDRTVSVIWRWDNMVWVSLANFQVVLSNINDTCTEKAMYVSQISQNRTAARVKANLICNKVKHESDDSFHLLWMWVCTMRKSKVSVLRVFDNVHLRCNHKYVDAN